MSVVAAHVPAPAVNIHGRLIQRCAVCGEKLMDCPFDEAHPLPEEMLTRRDGNGYTSEPFEEPLPADFCLSLVEAA